MRITRILLEASPNKVYEIDSNVTVIFGNTSDGKTLLFKLFEFALGASIGNIDISLAQKTFSGLSAISIYFDNMIVIKRMISQEMKAFITEDNIEKPFVSDKKYNLRIEAGLPPVNALSPSIVIRIHRNDMNINLERLLTVDGMIDGNIYNLLNDAILHEKNIVICGKGGSGKTTLLKGLINKIPNEIAITTNEETMELFIKGKNVIQREILENREESKKITLEKLTKHSLVMSNDVIVIGELKGSEALVFFDSIATGHVGLTTLHSDSVYNTIDRLITLIKRDSKAQSYKEHFINQMLASSINYIIFMKDYMVHEIAEVKFERETQKTIIKSLYRYEKIDNTNFEDSYYYIKE